MMLLLVIMGSNGVSKKLEPLVYIMFLLKEFILLYSNTSRDGYEHNRMNKEPRESMSHIF